MIEPIYWLCGALFLFTGTHIALDTTHPRRYATAAFWLLFGLATALGTYLPPAALGAIVLVAALLAGLGFTRGGAARTTSVEQREASAARLRNRIFLPALCIPIVTVLVAATGAPSLVGLAIGVGVALIAAWIIVRPKYPGVAFVEGRRLLEAIGWAALLPQMLATLGLLFTQAGVGTQVGALVTNVVPAHSRPAAVIAYALGMFVFTLIMGNAFAAFPIMTAAVGWPILVQQFGAHPAPMFAIGMLAGFCGTLCTPMAANFNLVPPALLDMRDRYGQIKTQLPTALALFAVNVGFMLIFPFW